LAEKYIYCEGMEPEELEKALRGITDISQVRELLQNSHPENFPDTVRE